MPTEGTAAAAVTPAAVMASRRPRSAEKRTTAPTNAIVMWPAALSGAMKSRRLKILLPSR
jgi:hypothetical protein